MGFNVLILAGKATTWSDKNSDQQLKHSTMNLVTKISSVFNSAMGSEHPKIIPSFTFNTFKSWQQMH
jgi:hypothetical protein